MDKLRTTYAQDLKHLKTEVQSMIERVMDTISAATEALLKADLQAAQEIIDADNILDAAALALDEHCYNILALQQPMAKDLRGIITALYMSNEIERAGDLATNIAKASHRMHGFKFGKPLEKIIKKMDKQSQRLLSTALEAYIKKDLYIAKALEDMDDDLDKLNYECMIAALNANAEGEIDPHTVVQISLIGRYFERIGDHAVNIGEKVEFMVTGHLHE